MFNLPDMAAVEKRGHGGPSFSPSPISAALSGGGHRATLFSLGALMAMRDAGIEPEQVSSVSGGSVTNLFLAYHTRDESEDSWDSATERLFRLIVDRGVLTRNWIIVIVAACISPLIALVLVGLLLDGLQWPWILLAIVASVSMLLLRGVFIEELMARHYLGQSRKGVLWSELVGPMERLVCATDLVTGRPLYASTNKSIVFRRTDDPTELGLPQTTVPSDQRTRPEGVISDATKIPVAALLRASAGFPGIPPRRLRLPKKANETAHVTKERCSEIAFLSDGGIWSNLATQPYEDRFLFDDYGPWIVFVIDASAELPQSKSFAYYLPLVAEFAALIRQAGILSANTVWPRRRSYHREVNWEMMHRFHARFRIERLYPVIALSETPMEAVKRLATGLDRGDDYTFQLDEYGQENVSKYREQHLKRARELQNMDLFLRLDQAAQQIEGGVDKVTKIPTTLSRIDEKTAFALIVRGYTNTAATLFVTGLAEFPTPSGWFATTLKM